MLSRRLGIALALLGAGTLHAGPFGLEKGMALEQVRARGAFEATNRSHVYKAETMKKGHPDGETHSIILTFSYEFDSFGECASELRALRQLSR